MVFTPLCRDNQIMTQGFLAKYCITNGFLMTIMYRHGIKIVNNKILRYQYLQNIAIFH